MLLSDACFLCNREVDLTKIVIDTTTGLVLKTVCYTCIQKHARELKQIFYVEKDAEIIKSIIKEPKLEQGSN